MTSDGRNETIAVICVAFGSKSPHRPRDAAVAACHQARSTAHFVVFAHGLAPLGVRDFLSFCIRELIGYHVIPALGKTVPILVFDLNNEGFALRDG